MADGHENPELPCVDKLVFDTKREAIGSATAIKYQRGTPLKAYRCRYCNLWHLSTSSD